MKKKLLCLSPAGHGRHGPLRDDSGARTGELITAALFFLVKRARTS